jgi:hypothetical protein
MLFEADYSPRSNMKNKASRNSLLANFFMTISGNNISLVSLDSSPSKSEYVKLYGN